MPAINGGGHFLFTEAGTFAHLGKSIFGGGHLKTTASKNSGDHLKVPVSINRFMEVGVLRQPPPKLAYFWRLSS
jgi:hypothetical protein